jgi:hypothetical protein
VFVVVEALACRGARRHLLHPRAVEQALPVGLQPLRATDQRLVDRLRARGQAPLQHGEREADGVAPLGVEFRGPVHAFADIPGHLFVEFELGVGEVVGDGLGDPLGKQWRALEGEQFLLDHPAHHATGVAGVRALDEPALELVTVEQGEEQLEVLLLARVRGRGHEQQVAGEPAEQLAELEALGPLDLGAEVVGAHPMGLIDDDQIPFGLGELGQQLIVAGQLIHPGDEQGVGLEHRLQARLRQLAGEDREVEAELEGQLVLPLFDEAARSDDEAALDVVADDQLLDEQARHDRLARAGVVGQQEAQRVAAEQIPVDRPDLVRQGPHIAGAHREHRVEHPGVGDPLGLGRQLEMGAVGVERPPPGRGLPQAGLVGEVEHLLPECPGSGPVGEFDRIAVPVDRQDGHRLAGDDTVELLAWGEIRQSNHPILPGTA